MKSIPFCVPFFGLTLPALAAVSDYVRTETADYNGYAGATLVTWVKATAPLGRAWALKFDMTKGFRLRCHYASSQMPIGSMGEAIAATGETPVAGINGDYFYNQNPTGAVIEDSRIVYRGQDSNASMWMQFFGETADHELFLGKLSRIDGLTDGNPSNGYDFAYKGKKVRNAKRVNWANYPVHNGQINPVNEDWPSGSSDHSLVKPNTIGNYQPRNTYPRTMIGYGTNEAGHAMLMLFVSDGRQADWSVGVADVDAAQMMIDEGCVEVGECDGGGSATLWAGAGGYLNRPSDGAPRSISSGFFVLAPRPRPICAQIGPYGYETFAEAEAAARPEERVERVRAAVGWFVAAADSTMPSGCQWTAEPDCRSGGFCAESEAPARLAASAPSPFIARIETQTTVVGGYTAKELAEIANRSQLQDAQHSLPRAACAVREDPATLELTWCGLVHTDAGAEWIDLKGQPAVSGETCTVVCEFKRIRRLPHVRYRIRRSGMPVTLFSSAGEEWFPVPGNGWQLDGMVELTAPAGVQMLSGFTDACPQQPALTVSIR
ncbi:MAG: phosphodiester glycosidase family protein [Kiritimatiellia bacterium]